MSSQVLVWEVPSVGISFRIRLLNKENPVLVEKVLAQLPFESTLGHTVVSGEGIWTPTRITSTAAGYMVKRHAGAVYFNAPAQLMTITYGESPESAFINKWADVFDEDLWKVKHVGKVVLDKTVSQARRELVKMTLRREGDTGSLRQLKGLPAPLPEFTGDWRQAVAHIQREVDRVWMVEPEEITKIKYGIIDSGMGTNGQSFTVLVHLEIFLIMDGAHILFRLLMDSEDEEATVGQMVRSTRRYLVKPFDHFEFLADLGLTRVKTLGDMYCEALKSVKTLEEYRELTGVFLCFITRMHQWIHFIFPWNLGVAFPHRTQKEVNALARL